jgi:hypothetical protein
MSYLYFLLPLLFLVAALPLKNYLEIKRVAKKDAYWSKWLSEKPDLKNYCEAHGQALESPFCDYCGSKRQMPNLEMVISFKPKFGVINNSVKQHSYFKSYICGGCGTELFRERYEGE